MGFAGFVNLIVLFFWQRPWPFITYAKLIVPNLSATYLDNSAFPSSHTYIAFAIATSVLLYGHKKLGLVLYVLAILVSLGRIGVGLHYPSDIIAGAILGILSGVIVYYVVRKYEQARKLTEI
jgi:undecaprenyl-diphosphatase